MRTFLLISPYFPLMSRSGAKRALHLTRTMPDQGWKPVVLAAPPGDEAVDPLLDDAIPADIPVYREYARVQARNSPNKPKKKRGKSSSPGPLKTFLSAAQRTFKLNAYATPFDRYLWDYRAAVRAGLRLIREHSISLIYACGDPFTALMVGARLKALTGLPLVLDLRDPWSMHEGKSGYATSPHRTRSLRP